MDTENAEAMKTPQPRGRKGIQGRATTIYLTASWPAFQQLCKDRLGVSGSKRLSELMRLDLDHMLGKDASNQATEQRIRESELMVANLILQVKKLKAFLTKLNVYDDLEDLVRDWKLDVETFKNLDSVTEKLINYKIKKSDKFSRDDLQLFVGFLSLVREKVLTARSLDQLRISKINGVTTIPPASPDSTAPVSTAKDAEAVSAASSGAMDQSTGAIKKFLESNLDPSQLETLRATNPKAKEILDGKKSNVDRVDTGTAKTPSKATNKSQSETELENLLESELSEEEEENLGNET
jgi:hypothetical protein